MFSRFSALRALLLLASTCSPVFSLPSSSPSALAQRSFKDYYDNLLYLDSKKSYLYTAISMGQDTYAACIDNRWNGLAVYGDKYSGDGSSQTIRIEEVSIQVQSGRTTVGIVEEQIELPYYHATSWPSNLPKIGINGVGSAYIGLDINSPNSPIYSYWAYKWPKDYSKWYYDVVLTYDWSKAKSSNIDFAGIIVVGKTVSWSDLLGISSSQVDQYGLPQLDKISSQPYIWLRDDATFYIDNCFWVNGKQTTWNSQVPKVESGKVVTDIYFTDRWSTFPDEVVEAIYGWVSGSKYYGESAYGYWQIPCDAKLSFTFAIDGHKYVLEEDALIAPNPWGDKCIGSIFTKGQAVAAIPTYDIIFGFQFLSSFYYRAGVDQEHNKRYYKLLPLPTPSGGWDNNKYYTTPSYPYTTWKPTYTTTYGGDSGYKGNDQGYNSASKGYNAGGNKYYGDDSYGYKNTYNQDSYHTTTSYGKPSYTSSYNGNSGYNGGYSGSHNGGDNDGYNGNSNNGGYNGGSYNGGSYNGGNNGGYNGGSNGGYNGGNNGGYNGYSTYTYSSPKYEYTSTASYYKPTYSSPSYDYSAPSPTNYHHTTPYGAPGYSSQHTTTTYYEQPKYTPSTQYDYNTDKHETYYSYSSPKYDYSSPKYDYTSTEGYAYKSSTTSWYKPQTTTYGWDQSKGGHDNNNGDKGYNYGSGYDDGKSYDKSTYGDHYDQKSTYGNHYDDKSTYGYDKSTYEYKPSASSYSTSTYGGSGSYGYDDKSYDYSNNAKVAGNLAEEDDDSAGTNWKDKAKLYEIIIIVLASVIGAGVVGSILAFAVGRRKKDTARPSAYSSIHDAEASEPKAPLYGSDGGKSRYADPYADKE